MTDQTNPKDPVVNELDELQSPQVVSTKEEKQVEPQASSGAKPKDVVEEKKVEEKKVEEKKVEEKKVEDKKEPVKEEKKAKPAKAPKVANAEKDEVLEKYRQMVMFVQNTVNSMEMDLKRVKLVLGKLAKFDLKDLSSLEVNPEMENALGTKALQDTYNEEDAEVVEGTFDGYFMVGKDQKKYPVPLNYSSKTKLVPGDILKLKIMEDGKFIYKLIKPIERKHMRALLSKTDENKFVAVTDEGKTFFLNQAAVTFYKGKPGDELYIVINQDETGGFAAIEAIIKK